MLSNVRLQTSVARFGQATFSLPWSCPSRRPSTASAARISSRRGVGGRTFSEVLIACALADKDDLGYFTASGVREPLERVTGRSYEIPAFARHLKEFASEKRGYALIKSGTPGRTFYRFENPLLQPFSILYALQKGLVTEDRLARRGHADARLDDLSEDVYADDLEDGDEE